METFQGTYTQELERAISPTPGLVYLNRTFEAAGGPRLAFLVP